MVTPYRNFLGSGFLSQAACSWFGVSCGSMWGRFGVLFRLCLGNIGQYIWDAMWFLLGMGLVSIWASKWVLCGLGLGIV